MNSTRNPRRFVGEEYDVVVLGGGIYGAMAALEATLRDLRVLLLEKADFGGATSYNSLRIIHGGLRDLRSLDIKRYRVFGREQSWFLKHFADLVKPLPILIPLYQRGLFRTELFRLVFGLDNLLSLTLHNSWRGGQNLPRGKVITPEEVLRHFPSVDDHGLRGGALWYDASVLDSHRLILEILHCVSDMGGDVLNYMPAVEILDEHSRISGVRVRDALDDAFYDIASPIVINATGPWSRENACKFDRDVPMLFRYSIGWNVLFDHEPLSPFALGVSPPGRGTQTYFLQAWQGRLLVGTGHAPRSRRSDYPRPSPEEMRSFINSLNSAVPALKLDTRDILHVFSGYLPVRESGTTQLTRSDCIIDHSGHGGPRGLYSLRSTKLTASRSTAEDVVTQIFPEREVLPERIERFRKIRIERAAGMRAREELELPDVNDPAVQRLLRKIVDEEWVCYLDDLIVRRTRLGAHPYRALETASDLTGIFGWDEKRSQMELGRVKDHFRWMKQPFKLRTV